MKPQGKNIKSGDKVKITFTITAEILTENDSDAVSANDIIYEMYSDLGLKSVVTGDSCDIVFVESEMSVEKIECKQ